MKKRKLLFGVLLASAAFSLAACTAKDNKTSTNEEKTSETTPTTPTTTPVESTEESKPVESTPEVEKVTVCFYEVVGSKATELTDLEMQIDKGSKVTLPDASKLAKEGYKIIGYYTSKGAQTAFNFDKAVEDDCDIYIKYEEKGEYDTYADDVHKVCAFDFNTGSMNTGSIEFGAQTPTYSTNEAADAKISGGEVTLTKNTFIVDPAQEMGTGIITMYFELTFNGVANKEAFVQIVGTSATKTKTEVIGLRSDTNSKFAYRLDQSSTDITFGTESIKTATKYKFVVKIDTADAKLNIDLNGENVVKDVEISVDMVKGLKFTAKSNGSTEKVIDNVAILFEAKNPSPIVSAKKQALSNINTYLASETVKAYDEVIQNMITDKANNFKTQIAAATTKEDVEAIEANWNTFKTTEKYLVTVNPYTAANTAETAIAPFKIAALAGETPDLSVVEYSLYEVGEFYSDAALTTAYTPAAVNANTPLYVKVTKCEAKSTYSFKASDLTATADNEKFAAGSYLLGTDKFFTLVSNGTAVKRYKEEAVYAIELEKSFNNYIMITTTGACTIKMHAGSTSSSNTTSGFGVYTDKGKTVASGTSAQTAEKTTDTELVFNISAAGTYYIGYTESGRAGRILSIDVIYPEVS